MIPQDVYVRYTEALIKGDRNACREIVTRLLEAKTPIRELYEGLFRRSLYEIGSLWETNRISVAVEHLATSITEHLLNLCYPYLFAGDHHGNSAVISCPADEFHQIGGKMVADMFELSGWDGYFLGSNTPVQDLLSFVEEKKPQLVGFSLSVYFNYPILEKAVLEVRSCFPGLEIIVGGQAFRWGGSEIAERVSRVSYLDSLASLEEFLGRRG